MGKSKALKIGLLSALFPTVTTVLLASLIGFVIKKVGVMGNNQIQQKAENYAALAESAPKNATVFFGDSITELCSIEDIYAQYSKETGVPLCNRGISAECTSQMLARLDKSIIAIEPRNLVMLMGVNDLNKGISHNEITENIRKMIIRVKENCPETNIVLQAVYPTDTNRESFYENFQLKGRDSATIKELNIKLKKMAEEEQVKFVDVTNLLADETGNLRKDYTYDGLHPNAKGYLAIRDEIIKNLI